jgi:hypothetical protein
VGEDCESFDPQNIEVVEIDGRWKIVDGSQVVLDFGDKEGEARAAFIIIQRYNFNSYCFVGRPDPSMEYFIVREFLVIGSMILFVGLLAKNGYFGVRMIGVLVSKSTPQRDRARFY